MFQRRQRETRSFKRLIHPFILPKLAREDTNEIHLTETPGKPREETASSAYAGEDQNFASFPPVLVAPWRTINPSSGAQAVSMRDARARALLRNKRRSVTARKQNPPRVFNFTLVIPGAFCLWFSASSFSRQRPRDSHSKYQEETSQHSTNVRRGVRGRRRRRRRRRRKRRKEKAKDKRKEEIGKWERKRKEVDRKSRVKSISVLFHRRVHYRSKVCGCMVLSDKT